MLAGKDNATFEETAQSAEQFQTRTVVVIPTYNPNYVINADQTRCEHHTNIWQTFSHKGVKTTQVLVLDLNRITHSYTAQYAITALGKLLPSVFICLQERSGIFVPQVFVFIIQLTASPC
jgi:hypothetical protein